MVTASTEDSPNVGLPGTVGYLTASDAARPHTPGMPPQSAVPLRDPASPYSPRLISTWLAETPDDTYRDVDGTVAFVDISGFTKLSERLARRGKVGAEDLTETIGGCFERLLAVAYDHGASLLKFGGDALLLLFTADDHPLHACRAAARMRQELRAMGPIDGDGRPVTLQMSVGVHTGCFQLFLVGDSHRELLITGPAASEVVRMEQAAERGEIVVSQSLAALLPQAVVGAAKGPGRLLRRAPAGGAVGSDVASPEAPSGDLASCLPTALREHLLSGSVEPEHRSVTVAFVQFTGTDSLINELGVAAAAAEIDHLVRDTQAAVDQHGVTFLGSDVDLDGGKLILVAGAPVTTGADDFGMLVALRDVLAVDRRLTVRAGVNRGAVFAGAIGPHYRRTYTVMGDAVNLAARVMGKAGSSQILMTEVVGERLDGRFETTALEPFAVKGKSALVRALVVGPMVASQTTAPVSRTGPLVGRDAELGALRLALESARAGRGSLFEIVGEPGIGKSRLVEELLADATDVSRVSGSGHSYERLTPYHAVRQLLRGVLGIDADSDQETAGRQLLEMLGAVAADLLPWAPLIAIPLHAVVSPTAEVDRLDDGFRKARLESSVVHLLERLLSGPTVVVIDDAHWVDEASADLLRALMLEMEEQPWLFCLLRRDVETGLSAPRTPQATQLCPGPLADEHLTALAEALTEDRPFAPHETAALVARAGGNPLFLAELLTATRAGGDRSVAELPDSLEAVVMARIDRLPSRERSLLRRLSVLGTTFDRQLAESTLGDELPGDDDPAWGRLAEFVAPDGPRSFRFQHTLIRDGAYESMPFRLRRELHARVGETLERASEGDSATLAGLLSLHYASAHRYPAALHYSRLAAEQARAIYAAVEAANFYVRAIDAAERLRLDPIELAPLHEAHGDVRQRIGEFGRAARAYRAARIAFGDDLIGRARMLLKQGVVRQRMGRFAQARRWFFQAKKALAGAEGSEAATLRAQVSVAFASLAKDEGRMRLVVKWSTRCLEEAQLAGDKESMARAYSFLDATFGMLGQWEKAAYSDQALELYLELDDLWGQGVVLNNLGTRAYWQGRWDDAVTLYERGGAAWEQIGDAVNAAISAVNIAEIRSDQGRLDEAEPLIRKALRVWGAAGDRAGVAYARSTLGRLAARAGRFDEAMELLEEAQAEFHAAGAEGDLRSTEACIAECLVLRGDGDLALALVDLPADDAAGGDPQEPLLHRIVGYAHAARGDITAAEAAFEHSLAAARARRTDYEVALTQRALADVTERLGGDSTALRAESAEILARLGVVQVPEPPALLTTRLS